MICASLPRNGKFLRLRPRQSRSRQHLAELDGGEPDTTACSVHEEDFARLDLCPIYQRVICRAVRSQKK